MDLKKQMHSFTIGYNGRRDGSGAFLCSLLATIEVVSLLKNIHRAPFLFFSISSNLCQSNAKSLVPYSGKLTAHIMTSNNDSVYLEVKRVGAILGNRAIFGDEHDLFILDPEDAEWLKNHGYLGRILSDTRMVRRSVLYSQSLNGHFDSNRVVVEPFVKIPVRLQSQETLEFMGFNQEHAEALWQMWNIRWETPYTLGIGGIPEDTARELCKTWVELGDTLKRDFLQFACHRIRTDDIDTDTANTEAWTLCLEDHNLSNSTVSSILDPAFRDVRLTKSAKYWALEFLQTNYRTLLHAKSISESRQRDIVLQDELSGKVGSLTLNSSQDSSKYSPPLWIAAHPYQVLVPPFRSNFHLETLSSGRPADFCNRAARMVLTAYPQLWVARRYAEYLTSNAKANPPFRFVRLCVPTTLLDTLDTEHLSGNDDWKAFVWHCRNNNRFIFDPPHLGHLTYKSLIVGPICKAYKRSIVNEPWNLLTAKNILRKDEPIESSEEAVQWMFLGYDTVCKLQSVAEIKVFNRSQILSAST